jgi:CelD/BcsL family acetyltransferase involved in cellulose biosynthesis/predicted TPR repeat methyltransferase
MPVEVIDSLERLAAVRPEWEAVYDADPEAHYFLSWTWLAKWLERFPDQWSILAVRPEEGAPYVAFLPLRTRIMSNKGGNPVNVLNLAGNYGADYAGMLCKAGYEEQAIPALAGHVRTLNWANLRLENFRASDRRFQLFMQGFPQELFPRVELNVTNKDGINNGICPFVTLPADWDTYLETQVSSNTRQKIRRFLRQVENSPEFRITHSESGTIERDIDILLGFWAEMWGERKGKRLANIVRSNRTMLRHAFATGTLFLPVLWHQDRPICALAFLVDLGKRAFLFLIGSRDESFRGPPAPGLVLHAYSIRHAITQGIATYDFLRGNETYKYSFGSQEVHLRSLALTTRDGRNLGARLGSEEVQQVFERSTMQHRAGQFDDAEEGYRQILATNPASPGALYGMGQLMAHRRDQLAAAKFFRTLVIVKPGMYKAWLRLGSALLAGGRMPEAAEAFCGALRQAPESVDACSMLGQTLTRLQLFSEAAAALDRVLVLAPDHAQAAALREKVLTARAAQTPADQTRRAAAYAGLRAQVAKALVPPDRATMHSLGAPAKVQESVGAAL